ncbi:MAG: DUF1611 domain-containing protein [Alphaproteobacteria bacterium]|nr:DUF1611 domain-containing protein [Alphaproteobacteria bacterium]|tara:strand:- start:18311 stop:19375 length:1065 start_codon:yes stop_codon:yes gene_type:complete
MASQSISALKTAKSVTEGPQRQLLLPAPYLVFLGNARSRADLKTAMGLREWAPDSCLGQYRMHPDVPGIGLPDLTFEAARKNGAKSLLIGIATDGGRLSESWWPDLRAAVRMGLGIISGMHQSLTTVPGLAALAEENGCHLIDIRHWQPPLTVGTGSKRSGKRLLTVGTDCAIGKKYTALAITRAMAERGQAATFRATGQTGIMLAGSGVPIDSVISDFISGAAEALSPANAQGHWDIIEGQGALGHPAYAAVSLGLLHGSQPDYIILCHQPGRATLDGFPDFPVPSLKNAIEINLAMGQLTNPHIRCAGISLNTAGLTPDERADLLERTADQHGVPCFDPMVSCLDPLLDFLL